MKKVLLCAGRTGGHFFPALALAQAMLRPASDFEIHLIVERQDLPFLKSRTVDDSRLHVHTIPVPSLAKLKSWEFPIRLFHYVAALLQSVALFIRLKPSLMVAFGSYSSVPEVLAASFLKVPILLHEQNAVPGQANQFLSYWADRVAVSFKETLGWFSLEKVFWSGFPVRREFLEHEVLKNIHGSGGAGNVETATPKRFKILVVGGSQGAHHLNTSVLHVFKRLSDEERQKFAVTHVTGQSDFNEVQISYLKLGMDCVTYPFLGDIAQEFKNSDLVIARAGAGTISELAACGRAAILIPYPHARAHQKANAFVLSEAKAARVIDEEKLTAEVLWQEIKTLAENRPAREILEQRIKSFFNLNACELMLTEGMKIVR